MTLESGFTLTKCPSERAFDYSPIQYTVTFGQRTKASFRITLNTLMLNIIDYVDDLITHLVKEIITNISKIFLMENIMTPINNRYY